MVALRIQTHAHEEKVYLDPEISPPQRDIGAAGHWKQNISVYVIEFQKH